MHERFKQLIRMSGRVAAMMLRNRTLWVHDMPAQHLRCIWWN